MRSEPALTSSTTVGAGSSGALAGTDGDETEADGSSTGEDPGDSTDPTAMCEAFAERCGEDVPFLCDELDEGLEVPQSCAPVATEYLACMDTLGCNEVANDNFACAEEFEAAHESCPSAFGFCRTRFSSIDNLQDDPESCESLSLGCIDGSEYALICEPQDGTTSCFCFVDTDLVGSFEKPKDAAANFCTGQDADDLAVEACGWPPGIVPPSPVG